MLEKIFPTLTCCSVYKNIAKCVIPIRLQENYIVPKYEVIIQTLHLINTKKKQTHIQPTTTISKSNPKDRVGYINLYMSCSYKFFLYIHFDFLPFQRLNHLYNYPLLPSKSYLVFLALFNSFDFQLSMLLYSILMTLKPFLDICSKFNSSNIR